LQISRADKKHARSRGTLLCLGPVQTVNVTRGCSGQCCFCYARCYSGAPQPGTVLLYEGLVAQLRIELDSSRRKKELPRYVILGSAGDVFLGGPRVLRVTRGCIEVLLARGVGVSVSTRGVIPDDIVGLLARYPRMVRVTVPLASVSDTYTQTWEVGTALPRQRLFQLQKLQEAGLSVNARIDPIIPLINDDTASVHELASALVSVGIQRAMLSFLELRRGVAEQLEREAPHDLLRPVLGCFPSLQDTGKPADFDHISLRQATAALHRIQTTCGEHGLHVAACRCHNPGLPAQHCPIAPEGPEPPPSQEDLFADSARSPS